MPTMSEFPTCSLCNEPVEIETAKTDENGLAVHEECYALEIKLESTKCIAISPMTLTCPRCGADAGQVCELFNGEVELIHVERIKAGSEKQSA
jgi:hypothetical protein